MQKSVKTCERNIVAPTEGVRRHFHVVAPTGAATRKELVIPPTAANRTSGGHFKSKEAAFLSRLALRNEPVLKKVIALADRSKYSLSPKSPFANLKPR